MEQEQDLLEEPQPDSSQDLSKYRLTYDEIEDWRRHPVSVAVMHVMREMRQNGVYDVRSLVSAGDLHAAALKEGCVKAIEEVVDLIKDFRQEAKERERITDE